LKENEKLGCFLVNPKYYLRLNFQNFRFQQHFTSFDPQLF
jgi:hypothetical protein